MFTKAEVPFLLSIVLLCVLWNEAQGRCSRCPRNACSQTGMSEGKCFRARYYTTTHLVSYYITTYYQGTSQGSSTYRCGSWFRRRRCTRYHTNYHKLSRRTLRYSEGERENLACDAYCCLGDEQLSGENCYSNGRVRLIGGATSREGRVEIWYNRQWNTVCDDDWDISDANVVCQQLGFQEAVIAHQSAHHGRGSGQILLDDLQCTGREASLLECSHRGINNHNCGHGEDASVTCATASFSSGAVRLTNGYVPSAGRVEIWYSDQWNTVCDDSWSITDARVVCRQLGYQGAAVAYDNANFGEGSGGILLDDLDCTGAETSLLQCTHNGLYSHNCDHDQDAGVKCGCGDHGTGVGLISSLSGTAVGDTVTYSCQSGYILSGSSTRTCQPNGYWSGNVPRCNRSCGTPKPLTNGRTIYTCTNVGCTVTYTCDPGYLMTAGSSRRTCLSNGQWSGGHPNCSRDCGDPGTPVNGRRSSGRTEGHTVTYTCNEGYELSGSATRTCQSNGSWSGSSATCPRSCGTPSSLSNGQRSYFNTTVGSTVTYTCNRGYLRTAGSSSRTCQSNGLWSGTHPTCTRSCGTPNPLTNGRTIYTCTTVGCTVQYTCNTRYEMTAGSSSRTCQPNGQWSGSHPRCTSIRPPSQVTDVSLTRYLRRGRPCLRVSWTAPQSDAPISRYRIQYKRTGSVFWGSEAATVGSPPPTIVTLISLAVGTNYTVRVSAASSNGRGQWSAEEIERTYRYPSRVTNVSLAMFGATSLKVTWAIPQSDMPITQYQVQYRTNASWSSAPPLSGSPPSNSTVLNGMQAGCIVRMRAMSDVGGGKWSAEQMFVVVCDEPESPMNGDVVRTGITHGDNASYFCHPGFTISGDGIRTCQPDGQWSGIQPECLGSCGTPKPLTNGRTNYTCTTVGCTVQYTCNTGYEKTAGSSSRTCKSDGQWSGSHPRCTIVCDEPESPMNGDVVRTGITQGDNASYFCHPGFTISGDGIRTCQPDGQWSGTQPECLVCCDPPVAPSNGGEVHSGKLEGDTVTYFCNKGYQLIGNESRTCQSNGEWSGIQPSCNETIDGGWSAWVNGTCSINCGGEGVQVDTRTCDNPPPQNGGKDCYGSPNRTGTCFTCPCDGGWSPWSPGPCSHTCGNGTRSSTRDCTTPDHPECCPGNSTMVETCVEDICPGNGSWIKVTNCSVECGGGGIQVFVRDCPASANGGKECEGPTHKIEYCGYCPCEGGWSPWSPGLCSHTCGNGTRTSTRNCTTPDHPDCCPGNSTMVETCSEGSCPSCSPCTWTVAWPCSKTCGGKGMQVLVRECNGGNPCEGPSHKVEPCGYCPCEGGWSPWSHGPCSHTCGNGTRTSTRNCTTPDHPDCCPGNSTMVEECSEGSCAVDGNWSDWREVLPCNKPCGGGGARVLIRECNNPEPANGGNDCVGEELKIDHTCADCPCEGGWSPWSHGPCSHNCGNGTRTSTRNCTTPDHLKCCPGNSTIIEACEEQKCSTVDGGWSSWQEAVACTATCGGGTRYLTRRCNNPTPANGGRDCEGDTIKADICAECPCDAGWSSWTQGICSGPCGQNGTAVATRKCNGPSQCCRGKRTRTETCTSAPC